MSAVIPFDRNSIELFQPNQISVLALWLDAADSATVLTSGANVKQWNDKSSNAHICISNANYVGTTLPTYNSNTTYKYLNFADSQALVTSSNWNYSPSWSCFVALNSVSLGARWLISPHNGTTPVMMGMNTGTPQNSSKIWLNGFSTAPADITGNHIEYTSAENTNASSNLLWYRDGVIQASNVKTLGSGSGTMKMGIGANGTLGNNMAGTYQLYEVLIFNSYLSPSNRQQIESYLAYKWGLQTLLPTTHPYYNSPYNAYPPFININQITKFAYPVLPSDIGGLALWLDAADSATITQVGASVTRWNDKSGNGFNMSNNALYQSPTYNTTGFNGQPTISFFRNSSNSLTILENTAFSFTSNSVTLFFICQRNIAGTTTTYQRFFSVASNINGTDNNSGVFNINSFGGISLERSTYLTSAFTTTNPFLGEVIINGTASAVGNFNTVTNYIYANGSQIGGSTTPTAGSNFNIVHVRLGAATNTSSGNDSGFGSLQGNISEIVMFNRALNLNEFRQIEAYLAYKWNLQSKLPSTHPYFNNFITPTITQSIPTAITMYQYSPRAISGLALWLDAADSATVSLSPGTQNVTGWNDKSGNLRNMTPTTNAFQYVSAFNGSYPTLSSDIAGGNGLIGSISPFTLPNPSIVFAVIQNRAVMDTGTSRFPYIFDANSSGNRAYAYCRNQDGLAAGQLRVSSGNNSDSATNPALMLTTAQVFTMEMGATNTLSYTNGKLISINAITGATLISGTISIGGSGTSSQWTGHFCEFIIFTTALTTNQRQQIERYLAWKWGLQSSLPANHPNKLFPPG